MTTTSTSNDSIPFPQFLSSLHRRRRQRERKENHARDTAASFVDDCKSGSGGDLILLQHSLSLPTTATVASGGGILSSFPSSQQQQELNHHNISEEEIYRRAQVRTPAETATRERVAGYLLLRHLVRESQRVMIVQTTDTILSSDWLSTQQHRQQQQQHQETKKKMTTIISVAHDTSGWDEDVQVEISEHPERQQDDLQQHRRSTQSDSIICASLENLDSLFQTMEQEIETLDSSNNSSKRDSRSDADANANGDDDGGDSGSVVVVIESLVPLVMVHGWARVMQGLQRIISSHDNMVLWIPIWTETLTFWQLMQLEDLALAVLWMRHGDLHLFQRPRQKYQQKQRPSRGGDSNTLATTTTTRARRGIIPFHINYNLEQQEWELVLLQSQELLEQSSNDKERMNNSEAQNPHQHSLSSTVAQICTPQVPAHSSSRTTTTKSVVLRLEEDARPAVSLSLPSSASSSNAPRPQIYLQDDDPEYDDLDEEDPDDDLDL